MTKAQEEQLAETAVKIEFFCARTANPDDFIDKLEELCDQYSLERDYFFKYSFEGSVNGFAHEHIVAGILMKKYQNVSLVDLPLSPYDIVIVRRLPDGSEDIIRAQVKTAPKTISFRGGGRGGVERKQISGVKQYVQSTKTSDVVIGVHADNAKSFDLYFIPTILIEELKQKSISLHRVAALKNNWEILDNCKNKGFVISECEKYGILR